MPATTTGTIALNNALAIMDELDNAEYNTRAVYFINTLCDKLYPFSENYVVPTNGIRPVATHITLLSQTLGIDDVLATSVLPYGLASQLMLSEDATQAANFENIFQERLAETRNIPAVPEAIEDVYHITDYSENTWY